MNEPIVPYGCNKKNLFVFKVMKITHSNTLISKLRMNLHFILGKFLFNTGIAGLTPWVHEKAMRQLQRAADRGQEEALLLFGVLLRYKGATPYNKIAGVEYLRGLAQSGRADAQFLFADALLDPKLITSDYKSENPLDWYKQAAEQQHPMAMLRLSKIYHNGLYGESIDDKKAEYWRARFMAVSGLNE